MTMAHYLVKKNDDDNMSEYVGGITEEMDKYNTIKAELEKKHDDYSYAWATYLMYPEASGKELLADFRIPGATRGCIVVEAIPESEQFRIKEFRFIEETCFGNLKCYSKEIVEAVKKFVGDILEFGEG